MDFGARKASIILISLQLSIEAKEMPAVY